MFSLFSLVEKHRLPLALLLLLSLCHSGEACTNVHMSMGKVKHDPVSLTCPKGKYEKGWIFSEDGLTKCSKRAFCRIVILTIQIVEAILERLRQRRSNR